MKRGVSLVGFQFGNVPLVNVSVVYVKKLRFIDKICMVAHDVPT